MITIVDYNVGNLLSISNMFKKIGQKDVLISNRAEDIQKAEKLVLPGVGHFDYGMNSLKTSGLVEILHQRVVRERTPILGICLGLQLMTQGSDEGEEMGLGWFKAKTIGFDVSRLNGQKIPHMGWSDIEVSKDNPLLPSNSLNMRYYFVHSFHVDAEDDKQILFKCHYGYDFVAGMQSENIFGVQFHPEKSHKYGMVLLSAFANL